MNSAPVGKRILGACAITSYSAMTGDMNSTPVGKRISGACAITSNLAINNYPQVPFHEYNNNS